jgi:hypothetical protein
MNRDHLDIVAQSIAGQRPADDQAYGALKVLSDRLRQVKSLGGPFAGIEFSGYVRELRQQCRAVLVG